MMGHQPPPQPSLFYTGINLETRIRSDHVLRKVTRMVDLDFVYQEVKDRYGVNPIGWTVTGLKLECPPGWLN